jgi:Spy/CpxP family protein refolding chaperone
MKLSKLALLAACVAGTVGMAAAQPDAPANEPADVHHGRMHVMHHRGEPPLARLVQKLDLTDAQRESLDSLLDSWKAQSEAFHAQMREAMKAATTTLPDDPNYLALIETRKQLASTAIEQRSDLNVQIFALLTPEQKAQVPQLIEEMKTQAKHWRGGVEDKDDQETHL